MRNTIKQVAVLVALLLTEGAQALPLCDLEKLDDSSSKIIKFVKSHSNDERLRLAISTTQKDAQKIGAKNCSTPKDADIQAGHIVILCSYPPKAGSPFAVMSFNTFEVNEDGHLVTYAGTNKDGACFTQIPFRSEADVFKKIRSTYLKGIENDDLTDSLAIAKQLTANGTDAEKGREAYNGGIDEAKAAYLQKNYAAALRQAQPLANKGQAEAQTLLGLMYQNGEGVEKNNSEAFKWYKKAAEHGHADAQTLLGARYRDGQGVEENSFEAFKWFKKAAEQGQVGAQEQVGLLLMQGRGVAENQKEGWDWLLKAAKQGQPMSQFLVGANLVQGEKVQKDAAEGMKWILKAAEQGFVEAQVVAGTLLRSGDEAAIPQNYERASYWYKKAADQGHARAQFDLGFMYVLGLGVGKDVDQGIYWIRKAADQGDEEAINTLKRAGNR